jgi:hypothetical protein
MMNRLLPILPFLLPFLANAQWFEKRPEGTVQLALPMDIPVEGGEWEITGKLETADDPALGHKVLRAGPGRSTVLRSSAKVSSPCDVTVWIKIPEEEGTKTADLDFGLEGQDVASAKYRLSAYANLNHAQFGERALRVTGRFGSFNASTYSEHMNVVDGRTSQVNTSKNFTFAPRFKEVSPVWDEDFRTEIEGAIANVPRIANTWIQMRIVQTAHSVRMYRDGMFIAGRRHAVPTHSPIALTIAPGVSVGKLEVRSLPDGDQERFVPVGLDMLANDKAIGKDGGVGLSPDGLPAAGAQVEINGMPFNFASRMRGNDHVDVGKSLFHYRNRQGHYMAKVTWPHPMELDPSRLTITVPNRPYQRLWLVAAHDGDKLDVPLVTARFYKPGAGFPVDAKADVPSFNARASTEGAVRLPVKYADGKDANLWLVPIELDSVTLASQFRDLPQMCLELTKAVHGYRTYPDPSNYSWFQGGLPSGVRIFAMTLERAPIRLITKGNRHGNVYVSPEPPVWQIELDNFTGKAVTADISVEVTAPDGQRESHKLQGHLPSWGQDSLQLPLQPQMFGLYDVVTTVRTNDGGTFTHSGKYCQLPVDDRNTSPRNSHWGLWNWNGGHDTNPDHEENHYLNRAAGSRFTRGDAQIRRKWGMAHSPEHLQYGPEPWSLEDEVDPEARAEYIEAIGKKAAKMYEKNPDATSFSIFTETSVSAPLTYGIPPQYLGEGQYQMDEAESRRFRGMMRTFEAAVEGIKKHAPKAPVALAWCESNFVEPFLEAGIDKKSFSWIGVDSPIFERLPEMPIREVTPNRMWLLKENMKLHGYSDIPVIHTESYYPTSHELALGHQRSADHTVRVSVLSLALESDVLANCFTLHDCAGYWGSQHYGCIGLIGRAPEFNPKPAFPMFSTMTRMIDTEKFDGFIPTGSATAYCVQFKSGTELTWCLWTVRGEREATLTMAKANPAVFVDPQGNSRELALDENLSAKVELSPTPVWIQGGTNKIASVTLGKPVHEAKPGPHTKLLDTMEKPWNYDPADYDKYAKNHWGCARYPGPMETKVVQSDQRKTDVWHIDLGQPDVKRELAAWYGVFTPPKPVDIPGQADALGIWANGNSNWGRIIYEIEDADGEVWQSIGKKDDWNCDDTHCWSYLEFPLPHHEPGDNYRGKDVVWWNFDKEGVVDLPVKLKKIIVELRTHNIYVDQLQEVPEGQRHVEFSNLLAVYGSPEKTTDAPVKLQRRARNKIQLPKIDLADLDNPIARLQGSGTGPEAQIVKIAPPDHFYDGTRVEVTVKEIDGATNYKVYVSAYESGAAAKVMGTSTEPTVLVKGLRPEFPLHLFATYTAGRNESKPSPMKRLLLKDDFPMK